MTWVFRAWLVGARVWPFGPPLTKAAKEDGCVWCVWYIVVFFLFVGVPMFFPVVLLFEGLYWLLLQPQRLMARAYWGQVTFRRDREGQLVARVGTRKPTFYVAYWGKPSSGGYYTDKRNLWKGVEQESYLEHYLDRHAEVFRAEEKRLQAEAQHAALFNTNTEIDSAGLLSLVPDAEAMPRLPQVTVAQLGELP